MNKLVYSIWIPLYLHEPYVVKVEIFWMNCQSIWAWRVVIQEINYYVDYSSCMWWSKNYIFLNFLKIVGIWTSWWNWNNYHIKGTWNFMYFRFIMFEEMNSTQYALKESCKNIYVNSYLYWIFPSWYALFPFLFSLQFFA